MEWISVEKRLPVKGRYCVLVWSRTSESPNVVLADTLKAGVKWNANGRQYTHWMPLPPAPPEEV